MFRLMEQTNPVNIRCTDMYLIFIPTKEHTCLVEFNDSIESHGPHQSQLN